MNNGRTPVTDALVEFVREVDAGSLPREVREAAGLCLMDWLGTAIRGALEGLTDIGALTALAGPAAVTGRSAD